MARALIRARNSPRGSAPKLTKRQAEIWTVIEEWRELPLQELLKIAETTPATIRKLEDLGLISVRPEISARDPYASEHILPTQPLPLNADQAKALAEIERTMDAGSAETAAKSVRTYLLHGVTGSGKTEVYLQALAHALERGQGAIVLVPEISLTPQTVERFKARFTSGSAKTLVAVLHSHLSSGNVMTNGTRSARAARGL